MKNVTESELWELVLQAGEAQAKLAELQLRLISLTRPAAPSVEQLWEATRSPVPAAAPKDKDVPF